MKSSKSFNFLVTVCSLVFAVSQLEAKAAPPTVLLHGNQYLIENSEKLSWYKARDYCQQNDMKLLSLDSAEKSQALIEYLKEQDFLNSDFIYWTSGTDLKEHGKYIWHGTGEAFTYTDWVTGMPDNWRGDEHCVEMNFRTLGKWNDNRCWYRRYFICERKMDQDDVVV